MPCKQGVDEHNIGINGRCLKETHVLRSDVRKSCGQSAVEHVYDYNNPFFSDSARLHYNQ